MRETAEAFFAKLLHDIDEVWRYRSSGILLNWLRGKFVDHGQECDDWCSNAMKYTIEALYAGRNIPTVLSYLATIAKNVAVKSIEQKRPGRLPEDIDLDSGDDEHDDDEGSLQALDPTLGQKILICVQHLPDQPCDDSRPHDGRARLKTIFRLRVGKKRERKHVVAVLVRLDKTSKPLSERTVSRRLERAKALVEQCVQGLFQSWTFPRQRNDQGD